MNANEDWWTSGPASEDAKAIQALIPELTTRLAIDCLIND